MIEKFFGLMRADNKILDTYPFDDFEEVKNRYENYNSVKKYDDQQIFIIKIEVVSSDG